MSSEVSAADEMGQAVANLVTEMSATTFDDVVSKWDAVCAEWQEQVAQLEDEVAHLQKELLVYDVAVKDEARVIKKLSAEVERLRRSNTSIGRRNLELVEERDRYREALEELNKLALDELGTDVETVHAEVIYDITHAALKGG